MILGPLAGILVLLLAEATPYLAPAPSPGELDRRREELCRRCGDGVIVIDAHGEEEGARVDRDFFYLTGLEAPGGRLLLRARDGVVAAELFLPARDPDWERWHGPRPFPGDSAERAAAVDLVHGLDSFPEALERALDGLPRVFLPAAREHPSRPAPHLVALLPGAMPGREVGIVTPRLHALRERKSTYEVDLLRRAARITGDGIYAGIRRARPGAWEFQVQGAIEGAFLEAGSPRPAFGSIVGSGPNSCVLHYQHNSRRIEGGELVVMDVGATAGGYAADVTRTIPVSGRFTERQRKIYDLVLAAQAAGIAAARAGGSLSAVDAAARRVAIEAGYGERFLHATSHHVGLEVHDPAVEDALSAGMVITVEPGIYIQEEALGVRIEDMVLVTDTGCDILTAHIPKEATDIEALVASLRSGSDPRRSVEPR